MLPSMRDQLSTFCYNAPNKSWLHISHLPNIGKWKWGLSNIHRSLNPSPCTYSIVAPLCMEHSQKITLTSDRKMETVLTVRVGGYDLCERWKLFWQNLWCLTHCHIGWKKSLQSIRYADQSSEGEYEWINAHQGTVGNLGCTLIWFGSE